MAYSEDIDDIPKSTVRAVAKKLKHYIDVQRREEAFDLSGVQHMMGSFTSSKGGSLYYDAMQDKFIVHYLSQPHLGKRTKEMGLKPRSNSTPRPMSAIMNYTKQEETQSHDNTKLVHTASRMLLTSNVKHLNRTGSAINRSATTSATRRPIKPSFSSSRPSSASTTSREDVRRTRPHRRPKQSTPKAQAAPLSNALDDTNLQPSLQRPDFSSSISSKASSLQSSETQSPEDDDLMHYTVHSTSKNQLFTTSTLFTRSDSALCMPVLQRRTIKNKQFKNDKHMEHQDVPAGRAKSTPTQHPSVTNNHPLENPSQVSYKITQDASTQIEESSSIVPNQSVMMVQSISSVGRIPVVTSSMQSIGLQVTECQDASTQTLNEVGIQTDLSAIMDQKRAERIKMKKQARKTSSRTSTTSEVPTVVITGPTDLPSNKSLTSAVVVSDLQDMEAARKEEELRKHIAATTIQQYYRGFKSGIRAKKSEQKFREQEPVITKRLPVGPSIHEAACTGNVDRIKELSLEASTLLNSLDEQGYTPLHCAAERGSLESVKMLSICGADMQKETPTGYTAIHIAALSGHVNCLKLLHALECSLRCQTVDKRTPLHLAAMRGHLECCKWLLSNRAKLTVRDGNDRTPLQLAMDNEQTLVVELLTKYENELKYAKGALKQLRTRRSNSTEGTDDEGWLSDAKQPDSPNIRSPGSIPATIVEEQRQLYEQIQKDKDENDSTFLDIARIAVEKELQNQPDEQPNQQVEQPAADQQPDQPAADQQPDQQIEQLDQQVEQPDEQSESDQQVNQKPELDQKPDQQSQHSGDGQNEVDNLNDKQSSIKEVSATQDHAEPGGDDTTKQTSEQPSDTEATTPIASQIDEQHKDETATVEQPENGIPDPSNIQGTTTAEEDTTVPAVPPELSSELAIQHQDEPTTEQASSQHKPADTQDSIESEVPGERTTMTDDQEENSTSMVAELSMENVAAHDIANPPVIERNATQQTLTTVTMIDNPIRLEQLSRSTLDSDDSKKFQSQQITQQPSTSTGNINKDDIIAIAGTVDTATMKSFISSSSLSNISALTDEEMPTSQ